MSIEPLRRTYRFKNFKLAMEFVNVVADLAERQDHHPDILIKYNEVELSVFTHSAKAVTEKDHQLLAACDILYTSRNLTAPRQ